MSRPILSLWPYFVMALPLLGAVVIGLWNPALCIPTFACVVAFFALYYWRNRWLWRFGRRVWRFRTLSDKRVLVHYAPELEDKWNWSIFLERCRADLDELTERFGFRLRRRPVVYLFANRREFSMIFGRPCGGRAILLATAVVIANDTNLDDLMRHEFAHLFSATWNFFAPPLLSEGLSVWLEETIAGRPIDKEARPLIANRNLKLPLLLKRKFFYGEPHRHACYVLAGSFTGFLMRRYGWKAYRKLYRRCDGVRFRAKFKRCFGVSFEKAEWQWRNELIIMEILKRRN